MNSRYKLVYILGITCTLVMKILVCLCIKNPLYASNNNNSFVKL